MIYFNEQLANLLLAETNLYITLRSIVLTGRARGKNCGLAAVIFPDSKVRGANMGPSGAYRTRVGPI